MRGATRAMCVTVQGRTSSSSSGGRWEGGNWGGGRDSSWRSTHAKGRRNSVFSSTKMVIVGRNST